MEAMSLPISGSRCLNFSTTRPMTKRIPDSSISLDSGAFPPVADNHSFDIVSEINTAEMHNAVVQAQHEIAVRYDFKGTRAAIDYNKKDNTLTLLADHKAQLE